MMSPFTDEMTQIYDKLISRLKLLTRGLMPTHGHVMALHNLTEYVALARSNRDLRSAMILIKKTLRRFLEGMCLAAPDSDVLIRFRDGHLLVLKALTHPRVSGHQWTSKQVTLVLIESRDEFRYNPEAVDLLIRNHLINLQAYDLHLTQSMENGINGMAVQFAMRLVKLYLVDERQSGLVTETHLFNTVETLSRISTLPRQLPDGLPQLLNLLRSSGEPTFLDRAPEGGPREFDDPPYLYNMTKFLLCEWVNMYHSPWAGRDSTRALGIFVRQINVYGILKTDELITGFFRLSTKMCVELCYLVLMDKSVKTSSEVREKCFHTLDAYVRLIALLVIHSGDANNTVTKINLLNKVLGIVTDVLLQDQELRKLEFQQLPYHRIFIMLFLELSAPESGLEAISSQILTAFCNTLYCLRPQKAPGFTYAWLEFVSHREFLGHVLEHSPAHKSWTMYSQLLISLFKFLDPFLKNAELAARISTLYRGTLRVLRVLANDFPEFFKFLCNYHYAICDVIAPNQNPSKANATNIDTSLVATEKDEKLVVPPEAVQDKVAFIVNNLSQANLSQKTDEFREIVKEEYWPWASQYLVMERASIEPNFHSLYSNFLDTLKLPDLSKLVIRETFRNIKVLLRSDKVITNFSDRSLLKNLGHWLGILTLAKCKPILQVEIDVKSLLVEAYHNGQKELLYVVPFVARVLESCAKSKIFKPLNPWTMGIMKVLAELHQEQDLKLNLKFEIEVLCKTLSIDINALKPGKILQDQERLLKIEPQLSPLPKHREQQAITSVNIQVPPQSAPVNVVPSTPSAIPNNVLREDTLQTSTTTSSPATLSTAQLSSLSSSMPQPQFTNGDINILSTTQLNQHLVVNGQLPLFKEHAALKQCVRPAVERAVQEWIAPVVERSIKFSLSTCEEIIKKDFALDPDVSRMRESAHHMVRSLTADMVMFTCSDPLYMSLIWNLRNAFTANLRNVTPQQKYVSDHTAQIVARDNLELSCSFIQKTAVEKALPEIDKRLSSAYEARKLARIKGRRYCDPMALTYQAERMPQQTRLMVGGVTPVQMGVYGEFAR